MAVAATALADSLPDHLMESRAESCGSFSHLQQTSRYPTAPRHILRYLPALQRNSLHYTTPNRTSLHHSTPNRTFRYRTAPHRTSLHPTALHGTPSLPWSWSGNVDRITTDLTNHRIMLYAEMFVSNPSGIQQILPTSQLVTDRDPTSTRKP